MQSKSYDAIIVGSGQAGSPLAVELAAAGWKVALVERKYLGGTCVNTGCKPTKTMVASAQIAAMARRSAEYGVHTGEIRVNLHEVRERKRAIVEGSRSSVEQQLKSVDVLMGEGSFTGAKSIRVQLNDGGIQELSADKIFINTGSRAKMLPLHGIDTVPVLDEAALMELDEMPEHLLVLGGGYIGLEFGQMFCRFGSSVTIIEAGTQLASKEDPDVAEEIAKILREDGIEVHLNAKAKDVRRESDGRITLTLETPEGEKTVTGSHLLMAVGRTPNTDKLNLQAAGIATDDKGYINVNQRLETNFPDVYAIGEVNGSPAFTHIAFDDYRILRANLLYGEKATTEDRMLPYTMFIDPQLGRVGLGEQDARKQGRDIKIAKLAMEKVARAKETGETRGFMKVIVDSKTDQILGCAILGMQGGEVMSMLQIAMIGKLPYTVLKDAIFAHPTLAESLNNLFTTLE